jgi:hypothetical protein
MAEQGGQLEKFVDSPYYYESELRGGEVTVSFSKYLPWQAIHFLPRSTHFFKRRWSNSFSPRTFQMTLVVAPSS